MSRSALSEGANTALKIICQGGAAKINTAALKNLHSS
jgi:hypothetical protein